MVWEKVPYSNLHNLDLDWIVNRIDNIETAEANASASADAAHNSETAAAESAAAAAESAESASVSAAASGNYADYIEEHALQIDTNTARIDNILVQGTPTEGNAELIDIRVGANGVTYPTAGTAVRTQVLNLSNSIDNIDIALNKTAPSSNLLDPDAIIPNTQIDANGIEEAYNGRNSSGWIPANTGDTVYLSGINSDGQMIALNAVSFLRLAWYNAAKQFIGAATWVNGYTLTAANIAYIRISYVNSTAMAQSPVIAVMFTEPTSVSDIKQYDAGGYHVEDTVARNMIKQIRPDRFVDGWGDSRIANGAGTTSVDKYLSGMLGWYVANHGYGGQGSGEIALRMGAIECYITLENNVITNGDNVITAMRVTHGNATQNVMQNSSSYASGVTCTVGGVDGYLWNYAGTPKFTPAETLAADINVMPMTKVLPNPSVSLLHRFIIIWAGKNDFSNYTASGFYEYLADMVSAIAEHVPHERFVILGETTTSSDPYKYGGAARTVMNNYNNLMARRFPNNFINIQNELVAHGLEMAGITPTETDRSDIASGWLPSSLMSDDTHQNAACRNVIAQIIYNFMKDRSWIE